MRFEGEKREKELKNNLAARFDLFLNAAQRRLLLPSDVRFTGFGGLRPGRFSSGSVLCLFFQVFFSAKEQVVLRSKALRSALLQRDSAPHRTAVTLDTLNGSNKTYKGERKTTQATLWFVVVGPVGVVSVLLL